MCALQAGAGEAQTAGAGTAADGPAGAGAAEGRGEEKSARTAGRS